MSTNFSRFRNVLTLLVAALALNAPGAAPVFNPANGHYYELVDGPIAWEAARLVASGTSHLGFPGHLATVTDAAENSFLTGAFTGDGLHLHWLGGFQSAGSLDPVASWAWVTGESFTFTNWEPGEPNDFGGADENRLMFDHGVGAEGKAWNDVVADYDAAAGYVVEFEAVPEPSGLWLLALGSTAGWWLRGRGVRSPGIGQTYGNPPTQMPGKGGVEFCKRWWA